MKMNKIAFVVISALCVFTFFSCDLLTKPLLEQIGLGDVLAYAPDAENLGNADTTVLANAAGDISIAADPVASKAVLEALGTKDEDEILDLSGEQKSNILSLTTSAILPVDQIISVATNAMNQSSESNGNNTTSSEDSMQTVIQDMIAAIPFVDTRATEYILMDAVGVNLEPGEEPPVISANDVPSIMLATISVAISACKSNGDNTVENIATDGASAMENLMKVFDDQQRDSITPETAASDIIDALCKPGETPNQAGKDSLTNALKIFLTLGSRDDIELSGEALMGMFTGGMMN